MRRRDMLPESLEIFFIGICFSAAPARGLGFALMIPSNHREEA